jgi:two-component system sensor histidine kinase QseC
VNYQLPIIYSMSKAPTFFNLTLPDGTEVRGLGLYFTPDVEGGRTNEAARGDEVVQRSANHVPRIGLVVAEDCENLTKTLDRLVLIILATSLPMLAAAIFAVRLVLRRGLRPLSRLADQTRHIGKDSLQTRFPTDGLPEELMPICGRLNDLLSRLELTFSEMSEYAGKVTHELRTPLAILRLKIEQAGEELPPELAEEFQGQLQHLAHVVEQSLCIARAEQGGLRLMPCPMDLAELVDDVAEDFSLLAHEQGRQVVSKKSGQRLEIFVDPKYTRQIIHNLLSNALKHGQGDIYIKLSGSREYSSVTILNRVPAKPSPAQETLGLGLRVVDSLLQLQPEIKSRRHHGRRFYAIRLSFPRGVSPAGGPVPVHGSKTAVTGV